MTKLTTKEDVELLVAEALEMFEQTGCVPDVDSKKVPAEKIVPLAKQYILDTIDKPGASYNTKVWHSPGYTLVLSWLSQRWLKKFQKFAPTILKDVDKHVPKDQQEMCLTRVQDGPAGPQTEAAASPNRPPSGERSGAADSGQAPPHTGATSDQDRHLMSPALLDTSIHAHRPCCLSADRANA